MAYIITGSTGDWTLVVGLEIHAQVASKAKLFSGAATDFGAAPNTQVSFVDAAFPGTLPVVNRECIAQAIRTGLALGAQINRISHFDRKSYIYPDLPPGYQISQWHRPIVGAGELEIDLPDGTVRQIGITRLHLEQDAGKLLHDRHRTRSYIDLNRAGVALMEIVSEPDIRSPEEAGAFLRKLRSILQYLGTCDGNMEEGSMRADVNVSVRKHGEPYRTRCEVKNLNSVRFAMQAIAVEAERQVAVWEAGDTVVQETRLFDSSRGVTRRMRSKEDAHDYRYFPDPDLPPLVLDEAWIEELRAGLPELPDAKKRRFMCEYGLSVNEASLLIADRATADFYERVAEGRDTKLAAHWIVGSLFALLKSTGRAITQSPISADNLGKLLDLVSDNTISGRTAKEVFGVMVETGKDPSDIVSDSGLSQIMDTTAIDGVVDRILIENASQVAEYTSGKRKLFGFLLGQAMKATRGKGNPTMINNALKGKLASLQVNNAG